MNEQSDRRRSWQKIPIWIAAVAVIAALGAIAVALRPSAPEPTSASWAPESRHVAAQTRTAPAAASVPRVSDPQHTVSKLLAVPLRAAQDALKSRNYADAIAKLEAADSVQSKSPYDQHVINVFLLAAYMGVKDYGSGARVVEAELNDGFLTSAEVEKETVVAAMINYQSKNYDKAIEFGTRAMRSESANPQVPTIVGQAYYLKGDWAGAERFEEDLANRQIAAGATPDKLSLELWTSACSKLRDDSCKRQSLERLIAYYPTPETQRELDRLRAAR
jgi:outer membrane protein assembly factor BamD (BamD/ComL family)